MLTYFCGLSGQDDIFTGGLRPISYSLLDL
jgi:hypothetical protein